MLRLNYKLNNTLKSLGAVNTGKREMGENPMRSRHCEGEFPI